MRRLTPIACLLALVACETSPAREQAPSATPSASVRPASASVAYRCEHAPEPSACAAPPTPWLAALVALGDRCAFPGVEQPSAETCAKARASVERALAAPREPPLVRVVAQNAALRVFAGAGRYCPELERPAAKLVATLALSAPELAALPATDLTGWLGPETGWQDMHASVRPHETLQHERVHRHTRAFRPLRSGTTRAIASELVAIDDRWNARLTGIAGELSLRAGLGEDAPACAAELDLASLACNPQLSARRTLDELPPSPFLFRDGPDRVGCNRCHALAKSTGANLEPGAENELAPRRERLLEEAQALAERAKAAATPSRGPR